MISKYHSSLVQLPEVLDGVVQDNVQEGVVALQQSAALAASSELDTDLFVNETAQIQDGLLLLPLSLSGFVDCGHYNCCPLICKNITIDLD